MPTCYKADYMVEELKSRLSALIEVSREDNFSIHFMHIVFRYKNRQVLGIVKDDHFKLWTQEQGPFGVTGIFYPVIHGTIRSSGNGVLIELRSAMNVIGLTIGLSLATPIYFRYHHHDDPAG